MRLEAIEVAVEAPSAEEARAFHRFSASLRSSSSERRRLERFSIRLHFDPGFLPNSQIAEMPFWSTGIADSETVIQRFRLAELGIETIWVRIDANGQILWGPERISLPTLPDEATVQEAPATPPSGSNAVSEFLLVMLSIIVAGLPFMLLGAISAGVVEILLRPQTLERWLAPGSWRSLAAPVLLSVLVPVCECGIVPVARRLLKKGGRPFPILFFMFANPGVNLITLGSTATAFGADHPVFHGRWIGAFLVAVVAALAGAWGIGRTGILRENADHGDHEHDVICACDHDHAHDHHSKMAAPSNHGDPCGCASDHHAAGAPLGAGDRLIRVAASDFLDLLFYVTVGAAITAAVRLLVPVSFFLEHGDSRLSAPLMMILASILSICSSADAFVAIGYRALPAGSLLAFLTLGPVFDIKLLLMFLGTFRASVVLRFVLASFTTVLLFAWIWNAVAS